MAAQAARAQARGRHFDAKCHAADDVSNWVTDANLTEPKIYTPRRADFDTWTTDEDGIDPFIHADQIHGIPKVFRELVVDDGLAVVSATPAPHAIGSGRRAARSPTICPAASGDAGDRVLSPPRGC